MQFEYHPEQLIDEVHQRPGIWNYHHEDYRKKNMRHKLWQEIVEKLLSAQTDEQISKSDKRELELQLQKRWKSLRDCFVKFSAGKMKTKRPYIYLKQLSFLSSVSGRSEARKRPAQDCSDKDSSDSEDKSRKLWRAKKNIKIPKAEASSDIEGDDDDNEDNYEEQEVFNTSDTSCHDMSLADKIKMNNSTISEFAFAAVDKNEADDSDRMFLLSLLPHLKAIPPHLILDAKLEIMQILKRYKNMSK